MISRPLIKIRSFLSISFSFRAFGAITILALLSSSAIFANIVYAQIFPNTQDKSAPASTPRSTLQPQLQPSPPKLHLVKITLPIKGEHVPVAGYLSISGTSADNATTSNCDVSVIVNGIKPYQHTTPTGTRGLSDYTKWNFTLNPQYTSIKEGQNKITAKFSCANTPALVAHSSVNVTGVAPVATSALTTTAMPNCKYHHQRHRQA